MKYRTLYAIQDFLHLTLFWKTQRIIKQLQNEPDIVERFKQLYRFLSYVKNKMPLEVCSEPPENEIPSWATLYVLLNYFSDRWCLSRVLRAYRFYEQWMYACYDHETAQSPIVDGNK